MMQNQRVNHSGLLQGWRRTEFEDKVETMTSFPGDQAFERQEKWEPVEEIETPAAHAVIHEDAGGLVITLMFSEIVDGSRSDLRISFGRALAYSVYEEVVHPWETLDVGPRLSGRWERYIYPLLLIKDSGWMNSLPNLLFVHPDCIHYRLLTLDQIVDVLCSKRPEARWVNGTES